MQPLIYSVEDDQNIQNVINIALTNSNFRVKVFDDAFELFNSLEKESPDLMLLDIMLPDINGLEILKKIRLIPKYAEIPIMIISAKISEVDKVIGLDMGADDYMIKPFGVLELVSRIKALLRRYSKRNEQGAINIKDLIINPKKFTCSYKGQEIQFTKKQFELLHFLMQNSNEVIHRDDIFNKIWGYDYVGETRTIDVHIKEIRKKIKEAGLDEKTIETVRGIGYKFIL